MMFPPGFMNIIKLNILNFIVIYKTIRLLTYAVSKLQIHLERFRSVAKVHFRTISTCFCVSYWLMLDFPGN